jgi:hypothetical protein
MINKLVSDLCRLFLFYVKPLPSTFYQKREQKFTEIRRQDVIVSNEVTDDAINAFLQHAIKRSTAWRKDKIVKKLADVDNFFFVFLFLLFLPKIILVFF